MYKINKKLIVGRNSIIHTARLQTALEIPRWPPLISTLLLNSYINFVPCALHVIDFTQNEPSVKTLMETNSKCIVDYVAPEHELEHIRQEGVVGVSKYNCVFSLISRE